MLWFFEKEEKYSISLLKNFPRCIIVINTGTVPRNARTVGSEVFHVTLVEMCKKALPKANEFFNLHNIKLYSFRCELYVVGLAIV